MSGQGAAAGPLRLIVGCGYLGLRVARLWRAEGAEVWAVTRSPERARRLEAEGLRPVVGDVARDDFCLAALPDQPLDAVLYAVGRDRGARTARRRVQAEGLRRVLAALPARTRVVVYVSSTGVYGQDRGEPVDEQTACVPRREGGRACLEAERLLRASRWAERAVVLRMAGLYGPGRLPRRRQVERGEPVPARPDGLVNLIHIDDAARVVVEAARRGGPRLLVVSDGRPVPRGEFYREMARLLGSPPPRFVPPPPGSAARQRAAGGKRAVNRRMLEQLGVRLAYPSYREGLAAVLRPPR